MYRYDLKPIPKNLREFSFSRLYSLRFHQLFPFLSEFF
nr:MAG TPA: hypothetical protein [Caudoviricetes sp.]